MRITEIELKGKRHILCLNLWALKRIFEHWGDYSSAMAAMTQNSLLERVGEQLIMLHTLLIGGSIYAAEMGMENPDVPELEELVSGEAFSLGAKLQGIINEALSKGMSTEIQTKTEGSGASAGSTSTAWYLWYGLHVGLSYREAHALPLGELLDLAAVERFKREGAKLQQSEEDEFFALLERK